MTTPKNLRDIASRILMQCIELRTIKRMPAVPCEECSIAWKDLRELADHMDKQMDTLVKPCPLELEESGSAGSKRVQ